MKICAVICEYNPFHNGHLYQLRKMRELGADKILCVMSGNFTQRGDAAVFDKYTRARHAILAGADAVIELPAPFAVSPAELFAQGAVHLVASIPAVTTLAFGCESGAKEDFLIASGATMSEDKAFKTSLKEKLKAGDSYVKARTDTILSLRPELRTMLTSPNNILGVEYCRALLKENSQIEPLPIQRIGAGHLDTAPQAEYSSASAIRGLLGDDSRRARKLLKENLPPYVLEDALSYVPTGYERAALAAMMAASDEKMALAPDCAEGLEKRIRAMARTNPTFEGMLEKVVTKRYTRSRIKRILLQNFLGISQRDVLSFVQSPLYLRVLAVKKEGAEGMLSALSEAKFPAVVRSSDYAALRKEALTCFAADMRANDLYAVLSSRRVGTFDTAFVP